MASIADNACTRESKEWWGKKGVENRKIVDEKNGYIFIIEWYVRIRCRPLVPAFPPPCSPFYTIFSSKIRSSIKRAQPPSLVEVHLHEA